MIGELNVKQTKSKASKVLRFKLIDSELPQGFLNHSMKSRRSKMLIPIRTVLVSASEHSLMSSQSRSRRSYFKINGYNPTRDKRRTGSF